MITLVLESSTYAGSVALLDDGRVASERTVAMRGREHEALMPAVAAVFDDVSRSPLEIGRVVCGAGPGAFTSLRIAGGIAKGIALAVGVPLIPLSSLALIVASLHPLVPGRYLASLDAMRGEHYTQLVIVSAAAEISVEGNVSLVSSDAVDGAAAGLEARAVGPGRTSGNAADPHARGASLLTNMIDATAAADLSAWEPVYGRLAEAQVRWEAEHGRVLDVR